MKNILLLGLMMVSACNSSSIEKVNPIDDYMNFQRVSTDDIRENYLQLLSDLRNEQGENPLTYSEVLENEASKHSQNMAQGLVAFGHAGSAERCTTISTELVSGKLCGEIIAKGHGSAESVFKSWEASAIHKGHMLNPQYTHTGVGIAKDSEGKLYWTQLFLQLN